MKKFLKHIFIWSIIAIIIAVFFDIMITIGLRRVDIRKYAAWNDIYRGNICADLVVVGSSRAWCGYNTYILDSLLHCNSYNLGLDGHYFDMQLVRYQTYRRYNSKPKVVIVNADFSTLGATTSHAQYEREQFFPYICDETLIDAVKDKKDISILERFLPLFRYYGYRDDYEDGVLAFFGKTKFTDGGMYKGYRGDEDSWKVGPLPERDSIKIETFDVPTIKLFVTFIEHLSKEDIKVVFVKSPVYEDFYQFINLQKSDSIFNAIAKHYNIPVLDYYLSDINKDTSNFINYTHLNKKGSELFTMKLCRDLDSLGVTAYLK